MAADSREKMEDGSLEECGDAVFSVALVSEAMTRVYCPHHALKFVHMALEIRGKASAPG